MKKERTLRPTRTCTRTPKGSQNGRKIGCVVPRVVCLLGEVGTIRTGVVGIVRTMAGEDMAGQGRLEGGGGGGGAGSMTLLPCKPLPRLVRDH